MDTLGLSTTQISMESLRVFISVIRSESRAWAKSSAGFKTMTTAAAKTAKIAITMRSSTRVKEGAEWNWVEEFKNVFLLWKLS